MQKDPIDSNKTLELPQVINKTTTLPSSPTRYIESSPFIIIIFPSSEVHNIFQGDSWTCGWPHRVIALDITCWANAQPCVDELKNCSHKYWRKHSPANGFKYVPPPGVVSKWTLSNIKHKWEGWSLLCRKATQLLQYYNWDLERKGWTCINLHLSKPWPWQLMSSQYHRYPFPMLVQLHMDCSQVYHQSKQAVASSVHGQELFVSKMHPGLLVSPLFVPYISNLEELWKTYCTSRVTLHKFLQGQFPQDLGKIMWCDTTRVILIKIHENLISGPFKIRKH